MLHRTSRLMPVFAAGVVGFGALALAAEPTVEELKAQVDVLSKKVEALEAKQVTAADVDATVHRILADAQQRSQLMNAEGFTAGYTNGKFVIKSADNAFSFSPTAQFQFRYEGAYRDAVPTKDLASYDDGFEARRAKFGFAGNVVSEDLTYKFVWATDRSNGTPKMEDAWVRYRFADNWAIFGGQLLDIVSHESIVSSSRQMAVEQSAVSNLLPPVNYIQGAGLAFENSTFRLQGIFHDGYNSANTKFFDTPAGDQPENYGASARAEVKLTGDSWKQYDDFTALGNKSDLLVVGAGLDATQYGDSDVYYHGVDVQWEPSAMPGFSAYAGFMGQFQNKMNNGNDTYYNYGFIGQVAYLVTDKLEVFGRYDVTLFDPSQFAATEKKINDSVSKTVHEVTLGVNYYINGHAAKITADAVFLPNGLDSNLPGVGSMDGSGLLPTNGGNFEVVGRIQFQLLL